MMVEIFLFQLLRHPAFSDLRFWILAAVYAALIAGAMIGKWNLLKKAGRTPWLCLIPFFRKPRTV